MRYEQALVAVVLSTYNGARYVSEQLESLLSQSHKNLRIIVRDDGSSDGTQAVLAEYAENYPCVSILLEPNIGVAQSFFRLLNHVPSEANFVAFCDQDDVWSQDKVERALLVLQDIDPKRPALYCGALEIVDERLTHLRIERLAKRGPSLANSLVQNIATGCTVVINQAAVRLAANKNLHPNEIVMHDWWLYQLVSAFGCVIYDDEPKIKYRQHGNNVVGSSTGIKQLLERINRQFSSKRGVITRQASELLRLYGNEMPPRNAGLIKEFLSSSRDRKLRRRITYAARMRVHRQTAFDTLMLRLLVVFSRI